MLKHPALAIFSHPNHEISIYGMAVRERPSIAYLTDGGGGARLEGTVKSLEAVGIQFREAAGILHSEESFYEALLRKDLSFWKSISSAIAELVLFHRPEVILCDAVEYYNPVHDMSLPLVLSALKQLGSSVEVLTVPLVWQEEAEGVELYVVQRSLPMDRKSEMAVPLSEEEGRRKREALRTFYGPLQAQMGFSDEQIRQACGTEYLVPAPSPLREPDPGCILRYDRRGLQAKKKGIVEEAILYRQHYLPIVRELLG